MKGGAGEIVQVQGGHIVRATGRKDRHSKVYTAKGPRDRRVRLSAHTAIQFYDVQDRLGYDRPSKAVDWLIKKAKSAIDKLAELPPWHPMDTDHNAGSAGAGAPAAEIVITDQSESSGYSPFIGSNLDIPDSIPDTMKSLFPISSSTASSMNFQGLLSRGGNSNQDLGLSLHPFQDPDFSGPGYEEGFQRMMGSNENRGGFSLPLFSQDTEFSQRGTLQSSFGNSVRAWNDLAMDSSHRSQEIHQNFLFGLPNFGIPARIHGEEEQSVVSDRPNSSSSPHDSQH